MKRYRFALLWLVVGFLLMGLGLWISSPHITSLQGGTPNRLALVTLPWRFNPVRNDNLLVVDFNIGRLSSKVWHIVPDDRVTRIQVNGKNVPLDQFPPSALRDYNRGFDLDLAPYLTTGSQRLEIQFDNTREGGGMDIKPVWGFWRHALIYLGTAIVLWIMAAGFRLKSSQRWMLILALIPIFLYWSATPWHMRAHDVGGMGGHYGYIEYIATRYAIPAATKGWVFYHPPAYYIAGAGVFTVARALNLPVPETLQLFSILLWLVFLAASLACVNLFTRDKPETRFAASLALVLWPAGIAHSPAIGNDAALFPVAALATWMLCRWWSTGRRRHLIWLAVLCGLSLMIKSNGITLVAVAGLLLLLRFAWQNAGFRLRAFADTTYFGLITGAFLAGSFASRVYYYLKGQTSSWLISNVGGLSKSLSVPADIKAFLPLDVPTFLTEPYLNTYSSATGRDNFWNTLLRTSISGEFGFSEPVVKAMAIVMGVALFFLFFGSIVAIPRIWQAYKDKTYKRFLPLFLLVIVWVASIMALRISAPYACSNDFRYILPVVIPLAILWSRQGVWPRRFLVVFAAASLVFYSAVGFAG